MKLKKTKTGLHIGVRKNRIEVYTQKELEEKLIREQEARDLIIKIAIIFFAIVTFAFGFLLGHSS